MTTDPMARRIPEPSARPPRGMLHPIHLTALTEENPLTVPTAPTVANALPVKQHTVSLAAYDDDTVVMHLNGDSTDGQAFGSMVEALAALGSEITGRDVQVSIGKPDTFPASTIDRGVEAAERGGIAIRRDPVRPVSGADGPMSVGIPTETVVVHDAAPLAPPVG